MSNINTLFILVTQHPIVLIILILNLIMLYIVLNMIELAKDKKDYGDESSAHVSDIIVYPIKSCGGIHMKTVKLCPRGFMYDRIFAIVDKNNCKISIRCHPKMATIKPELNLEECYLSVSMPTMPTECRFSLKESACIHTKPLKINIWDEIIDCFEVSEEVSEWFCEALNDTGLKCVRMCDDTVRPTDRLFSHKGQNSLSDGFPFLMASENSLNSVNDKIKELYPSKERISMEQFRPNIVIKHCKAFEEDSWESIDITSPVTGQYINMTVAKPCSRCSLPNVNAFTGVRDNDLPVTKALKTYRTGAHLELREDWKDATFFGVHLDHHDLGFSGGGCGTGGIAKEPVDANSYLSEISVGDHIFSTGKV